jgi:hypothetical protein
MILVAATALALGFLRQSWPEVRDLIPGDYRPWKLEPQTWSMNSFVLSWAGPTLLAAWSYAFLVLRFRSNPLPRRRLARQPGLIACGVAAALIPVTLTLSTLGFLWRHDRFPFTWFDLPRSLPGFIGQAVAGAWVATAFAGRWRREPGWLDRMGIGVGTGWIILYFEPRIFRIFSG